MRKTLNKSFEERVKMLVRIGREYSDLGPSKLAEDYGVSKQRIEQIATILRKRGVDIPRLRVKKGAFKRALDEAVKQLLK